MKTKNHLKQTVATMLVSAALFSSAQAADALKMEC